MPDSCPTAATHLAVEPGQRFPLLAGILQFLYRRRIPVSAAVFLLLLAQDFFVGNKPHDVVNFRDPYSAIGVVLVLLGLVLRSWAAGVLQKDFSLTTSGPYRLTRNPLYIGSFLMMLGFCTVVGDAKNFAVILGPMLFLYLLKVRDEESGLARHFGSAWNQYVQQTPRFFPRQVRTNGMADWRLAEWLRSREYQAVGTSLLALIAIKLWHGM